MKTCNRCNTAKEDSEFSLRNRSTGRLQPYCKPCNRAYNKQHYVDNRKQYRQKLVERREQYRREFYAYLQTKACVDCGESDFRVLEFDHLRDKEFNIAEKVASMPLETLMKEIEKCEVVCANCHRIRTAERGNHYKYLKE